MYTSEFIKMLVEHMAAGGDKEIRCQIGNDKYEVDSVTSSKHRTYVELKKVDVQNAKLRPGKNVKQVE